jgi:hypothetical protein
LKAEIHSMGLRCTFETKRLKVGKVPRRPYTITTLSSRQRRFRDRQTAEV